MFDFLDTSFKRRAFAKALAEVEKEGYYINQYYAEQNVAVLDDNTREVADLNNYGEKKDVIEEQVLNLDTLNEKAANLDVVAEPEKIAPSLSNGVVLEPVETLSNTETVSASQSEIDEAYRLARERASEMYSQSAKANAETQIAEKTEPVQEVKVKETAKPSETHERTKEEIQREIRRNEIRKLFLSSIIEKNKREKEKAKATSELTDIVAKKTAEKPVKTETSAVKKVEVKTEKEVVHPIKEAVKKVMRKNAAPRKRRRRYDADIIGGYY